MGHTINNTAKEAYVRKRENSCCNFLFQAPELTGHESNDKIKTNKI